MLKRKIYDTLLEWKNEPRREGVKDCLLINGARQVGKTYIIDEFGKNEYKAYVKLNFAKEKKWKEIFEESLSPDVIYSKLSLYLDGFKIIPGDTLIFLDEIQLCGNARTALKFLAMDDRCDVIASGSLLGLRYGDDDDDEVTEVVSYPVGYERPITMYPLDFEEFVWALGYTGEQVNLIREYFDKKEKVPKVVNDKWEEMFREYIVVGGMPEVVAAYVETKNYNVVGKIQDKILKDYKEDIAKHAKGANKVKVRKCYDTIPISLSKENKKFKYGDVINKSTRRDLEDSITWLVDSEMVLLCRNLEKPEIPLRYNSKDNDFKLYLNDTGLLLALYGRETKLGILNDSLKGNGKGGIYENVIAGILHKKEYNLNFYKVNDYSELEFVIEKDGVCPIEVKAGNNASKFLNTFISNYDPTNAYKLTSGNIGYVDGKLTLPHYMITFI